jgi:hypothetical protein
MMILLLICALKWAHLPENKGALEMSAEKPFVKRMIHKRKSKIVMKT